MTNEVYRRPPTNAKRRGVRQSSAAFGFGYAVESGRGLPQSKIWRRVDDPLNEACWVEWVDWVDSAPQISTGLGGGKGREIQGFCGVDGLRGPEVFLIPVLAAGGWIRE